MPTQKVIEGHRRFRERFESDNEVFTRLAEEGQNPKVLWIGCSDSRVIPELITGAEPGELFNVRNIANVVPPASGEACSTGAAIEYAVIHLRVDHVVVCGHTGCGGIKALEAPPPPAGEPHIAGWLELAAPARRQVLARGVPPDEVYLETVKANVLLQCENLRSYPCVRAHEQAGDLSVHAWLYDLRSGVIEEYRQATGAWESIAHSR
jgi:carbonic anhydrase